MNAGTKRAFINGFLSSDASSNEIHARRYITPLMFESVRNKSELLKQFAEQNKHLAGHLASQKATMFQSFGECIVMEHILYAFGYGELRHLLSVFYDRAYEEGMRDAFDFMKRVPS